MSETKPITKSILLTIKKMLGIAEEYHAFDIDIVTNINSVFLTLNQLGVGPSLPFSISDETAVWSDFLGNQEEFLQGVQTYVYLKTRLLFDPPTNSFLVDAMKKQAEEFEWRLMIQPKSTAEKAYEDSFNADYPESVSPSPPDENQNGSDDDGKTEPEENVTPITMSMRRGKRAKVNPVTMEDWMDIFS